MKKDFNEIFEHQPLSNEAPQGLRNKMEFAARQNVRKPWFGTGTRWAAAAAAVVGAGFFVSTMLTPASAEAKTWDMVTAAYQNVRGMLMRIQFNGDGESGAIQIASKGQEWRVAITGMGEGQLDVSYQNGEMTLWNGGDTAQIMKIPLPIDMSPEMFVKKITEEVTVSKILEKGADEIGRDNIHVEQPVEIDGRRVYNVYITNIDHGNGRVHMLVDAETDLPISMSFDGENGEAFRMEFDFNAEFDDSLLRPVLPSGIKFNYMDIGNLGKDVEGFGREMEEAFKGLGEGFDYDEDKNGEVIREIKIEGASIVR